MKEDKVEGLGCLLIVAAGALAIAAPTIIEIIKTVQGR